MTNATINATNGITTVEEQQSENLLREQLTNLKVGDRLKVYRKAIYGNRQGGAEVESVKTVTYVGDVVSGRAGHGDDGKFRIIGWGPRTNRKTHNVSLGKAAGYMYGRKTRYQVISVDAR